MRCLAVWCGVARCGPVWPGVARCGPVWPGASRPLLPPGCGHSTTFAKPLKSVRTKRKIQPHVLHTKPAAPFLHLVLTNFEGFCKTSEIYKDQAHFPETRCIFALGPCIFFANFAKPLKSARTKRKIQPYVLHTKPAAPFLHLVLINFEGFCKTSEIHKDQAHFPETRCIFALGPCIFLQISQKHKKRKDQVQKCKAVFANVLGPCEFHWFCQNLQN